MDASNYLDKAKYHSEIAFRRAQTMNKSYMASKNNYAAMMIEAGDPQEMKKGYDLLIEERKETPQVAGIAYNIAVYFAKLRKFDEALGCLERAKSLGDFSTQSDIDSWEQDHDFDLLRQSSIEDHKARIEKLINDKTSFHLDGNSCAVL